MRSLASRASLLAASAALALWAGWACDGSAGGGAQSTATVEPATVYDCDSNQVDLASEVAAHDASLVTFAAKWCEACKEEAPRLNSELVDGFAGGKGDVGVYQVLVEADPGQAPPQELCAQWRDALGARFTVLVDRDQVTVPQYFDGAVGQLPYHVVATRDGKIRFSLLDGLPDNIATIIQDWLP